MSRATRRAVGTVVIVTAMLLTMGAGLTYAVNRAGVIEVDIHAKGPGGTDLRGLKIPGSLAEAALVCIPSSAFREAHEEIGEFGPLMRKACQALARQDDFTLVEVRSDSETVLIRKEGNHLVIEVDTFDERIHVKVPISLAEAFAKKLENRNRWL